MLNETINIHLHLKKYMVIQLIAQQMLLQYNNRHYLLQSVSKHMHYVCKTVSE